MFDREQLETVVDLQQRSYQLLLWVSSAITEGYIEFQTAHRYSKTADAAKAWIMGHYDNIPSKARPQKEHLDAFSKLFTTYLENSFELVDDPGQILYSEDAHCFCPICSWLVEAPNLKPKKLTTRDKKRAMNMRIAAIQQLALSNEILLDEAQARQILTERKVCEDAALIAYGIDLLSRQQGIANGPAVLSLWRGFAWNSLGSPKPGFKLSADEILAAETRLRSKLLTV